MKLISTLALIIASLSFPAFAQSEANGVLRQCKEGTRAIILETGENDASERVQYVCRSGKWVRQF